MSVQIEWRLRRVMASRDVYRATDLRDLLANRGGLELSKQSVSDLINRPPVHVKLRTLQALCTALGCTPNELFGVDKPDDVSIGDEPEDSGSVEEK